VDGEMNLIMLVYNIKRTLSILGFEKCCKLLKTGNRITASDLCFKRLFLKIIYRLNEREILLSDFGYFIESCGNER
jgi:hypothetical protein